MDSSPKERETRAIRQGGQGPAVGEAPGRRIRVLDALRNSGLRPDTGALRVTEFRHFWYGSIVSNIGSWMQMVAQGWLILELTNSPFYLGLVGLVRAVPALSITLVGGVLADRLDRRKMLIFTQVCAAVLAITLGILDLTNLVRIWHILVIAFLTSAIMSLDNPARQSMVPDLVGKENVASAVGLNSAAWNAAAIVGPSLAGVLVAIVSTAGAFLLNGVSYLAVVYAVWRMTPRPRRPRGTQSILQNLVAGLRFAAADARIWGIMLVLTVATFLGRPYIQLMPVFARDILQMGPSGYGLLMGTVGVGALVGALSVGTLAQFERKGMLLLGIVGVFGVSLTMFALSSWLLLSIPLLLITGAAQTLFMALTNTLLQLNVPEEMRGRTMALYSLIPMGFMPLGTMALGSVGDLVGVPLTVATGGAIVVVATLLAARLVPAVRQLR